MKRTCISIFSQICFVDLSKPCTLIYKQKLASFINLQLPIINLKKSIIWDMPHRKTYMYINFYQTQLVDQSKLCSLINLQKMASCINLQLSIVIFKRFTLSDIHHCITYMYINFQQNRVSRSVKIVHTKCFQKNANCINLQLAIRILKKYAFRTCTTI